ncbi:unnamed protein product [Hermetia illucens]|uniref:Uncharacterized protein n=1 Tax=Hermetia illucens TaxID=343691 RepID=A0A7R8V5D1_HERIL|nr:cuticle protein 16.8 [Hermetia illucens]CAD7092407.1 unnamed protein product [Hermetia illucens]
MKIVVQLVALSCLISLALADVSHILGHQHPGEGYEHEQHLRTSTPPPPPRPYVFSYTAGRYPNHTDRSHTEVSDGSGTVRGKFAYVDPRNELRTVEYVADQYGFHPALSHEPQDTEAVKLATAKHLDLYHRIAASHQDPTISFQPAAAPVDSAAVAHRKAYHAALFEKIASEHARIGAEREAERAAFEATSEANHLGYDEQHYQH